MVPGTGLLKPLEFPVIRTIKVPFIMLMETFGKPLSKLSMEAMPWGTIQVIGELKLSGLQPLNLPTSREGTGLEVELIASGQGFNQS